MLNTKNLLLVYDRECPVCHHYCQLLRIREAVGDLKIINAREDSDVMKDITGQGLDIDHGMVLKIGDMTYYGADAIHKLALMSTRAGFFNKLNYWLFKSKAISMIIYPLLRFFRNMLLKILGKTRINNLGIAGKEKF